jgi:hypothetical protein
MKKILVLVLLFAFSFANATVTPANLNYQPPSPGPNDENGGWGNSCIEWDDCEGSFETNQGDTLFFVIYDPINDQWEYCGTNPLVYAEIKLHLWVEMYMYLYYEYTTYKWHRLGMTVNGEEVCFIIQGLIRSNSAQNVGLIEDEDDLGFLHFRGSIFGDPGDYEANDPNLPITWSGRYGAGSTYGDNVIMGWTEIDPEILGDVRGVWLPPIGKCDHWFQFRGCFFIPYHIDDGYYSLTIGGCPTPVL